MRRPAVYAADLFLVIFIHLTRVVHAASATCYAPNGNSSSENFWAPCPLSLGNDGFAMCCKSDSPFDFKCLANGLCQLNVTNAALGEVPAIIRGSCTDHSWKSPSCVQLCASGIDGAGAVMNRTDEAVTQCSDSTYCCGSSNGAGTGVGDVCCKSHQGVFLVDGKVSNANPSSTGSAVPAVTATTSAPPVTLSPTPSNSLSTGAIAGGVVGGVAGLALVIGAISWFLVRSRRKRRAQNSTAPDLRGEEYANATGQYGQDDKKDIGGVLRTPTREMGEIQSSGYLSGGPAQEMEDPGWPHELIAGTEPRFEMDGEPQYRRFQ